MSEQGVPASVLSFVSRHIESLEQLEILLMLEGEPGKTWTLSEIFQKIQSTQISVQHRLFQLQAAGLVEGDDKGFRFKPANDEIASCVAALAENYRLRRVRIIEAIYAPKKDAAQTFADAFKIRRND